MKNQELIRKVFQTLTVILFIIQFHQSLKKYFEHPVVVQTSHVLVQDLQAPVVYICQDDQFNYTKSESNGYKYITHFMAGYLMNTSTISWKGYHGNHTYKELEALLFDYDYSTLNLSINQIWGYNNTLQKKFMFPHGICMKLLDVQSKPWIEVETTKKVRVLFVDPAKANSIRTGENFGAEVSIGPVSNTHYGLGIYEVDYSLHDDTIYEGSSCTNYGKLDSSYGECLKTVLIDQFMANYGCIAPWIPGNNSEQVCDNGIKIKATSTKHNLIYQILDELARNKDPDVFRKCLPPCKTMGITLQRVLDMSNLVDNAFFEAKAKNWRQYTNRSSAMIS